MLVRSMFLVHECFVLLQAAGVMQEGAPQQPYLKSPGNEAQPAQPAQLAPSPVPLANATNTGNKAPAEDQTTRKRPPAISKNPFARKAAKK